MFMNRTVYDTIHDSKFKLFNTRYDSQFK